MKLFTLFVLIILILIVITYCYVKKKYSFFETHGVPYLKPQFPFGSLQKVGSSIHMFEFLITSYNQFKRVGKIAGFYNVFEPIYLITDIEVMKAITVKDFNKFVNRGIFVNEENEPLTGHLFAIEGDRWKFIRKRLRPAFTSQRLISMYSKISRLGCKLVESIEKSTKSEKVSIDIKNVATRFTIDIISSVAFGMDSETLNDKNEELLDMFKEVIGANRPNVVKFLILSAFPNLAKILKIRLFSDKLSDFFAKEVGGNIKVRERISENPNDFLSFLIKLKNTASSSRKTRKLTLDECLAQAFLFFFAGSDTSSTTISFALTELAFNQDVQDKVRFEILEKTKGTKGEISYEALHEMTYLSQVVNETLRKYPPGFSILRTANEDYKVPDSKIIIKKGSQVVIPTIGFHYDEKYWKNPMKFDPERFTVEETAKRQPQCYFPFGEGPRNCALERDLALLMSNTELQNSSKILKLHQMQI
ncbi:unnamed protein product [Chironomus riparius]|uniref:Cytochrome P450 n=1 Tax=Chironomus riparius TaxID=315576 RepID=A0A9N9WRN1_9DIPT|nr:unnamed protein product [Chironomus riparius]